MPVFAMAPAPPRTARAGPSPAAIANRSATRRRDISGHLISPLPRRDRFASLAEGDAGRGRGWLSVRAHARSRSRCSRPRQKVRLLRTWTALCGGLGVDARHCDLAPFPYQRTCLRNRNQRIGPTSYGPDSCWAAPRCLNDTVWPRSFATWTSTPSHLLPCSTETTRRLTKNSTSSNKSSGRPSRRILSKGCGAAAWSSVCRSCTRTRLPRHSSATEAWLISTASACPQSSTSGGASPPSTIGSSTVRT